jgi:hypothetical protein
VNAQEIAAANISVAHQRQRCQEHLATGDMRPRVTGMVSGKAERVDQDRAPLELNVVSAGVL